jgi:peptidoglycan/xylan/chitin deacetylase (PgdA/CDA1 family)
MTQPELNTVCLTFDFDAMSVWLGGYPHVTPAMLSRGEFGAQVGVPRILELLRRFDLRATFFTPGHTAESFPEALVAILEAGHEVGHHGYGHEDPSTQTPAEERASLERGLVALDKVTGQRPRGYRSPSWDYSGVTLSLLVEYAFVYDSSLFAGDFYPYHPRLSDEVSKDQPLCRGKPVPIWEFPVHFALDDWPL